MKPLLTLLVLCSLAQACLPGKEDPSYSEYYQGFPYQLHKAQRKIMLPPRLEEISGLDWAGNNQVWSHNDEDGEVYLFDLGQEIIAQTFPLDEDRDYEGIALAPERFLAVLESDGDLHMSRIPPQGDTDKQDTDLDADCDAEGLCFDRKENRLWIACKGETEDVEDARGIFAFDLRTRQVNEQRSFAMDFEKAREALKKSGFEPDEDYSFGPSGVALHPKTGNLYIVAHRGKALLVCSPQGKLKEARPLSPRLFPQPEGITFSPGGTLYIANEAAGGQAEILVFETASNE